jgi:carboxyl-terminal processing protease
VARYYTPLGRSIQKPYDMDEADYDHEVADRYANGEDTLPAEPDTTDLEVFVTPAGKRVYGGGGITPDVRVPIDRSPVDTVFAAILGSGSISRYAYRYQTTARKALAAYADPSAFQRGFQVQDAMLDAFLSYAGNDSIDTRGLLPSSRQRLAKLLKAQIARQVWRTEGWFEVMNEGDPYIGKALEALR